MSRDFEYDPESGSFRAVSDDPRSRKKKEGGDLGGWILIAALFAVGLWPIGLIALISKLSDKPRKAAPLRGTGADTGRVVRTAKKMNRAPEASAGTARVLMTVGGILTAVFGIGLLSTLGEAVGYGWDASLFEDIFSIGGFFAGGTVMLAAGWRMKRRSVRIARYLAVMGERGYISLDELCAVSGKKRGTVERDVEFMLEKNMFDAGAYLDSGRGVLFRSADAFAEYAGERAKRENVTPKEANEGYAGALRAIRAANDRIADPVLSAKIDHLEDVAGKIFREVEQHPEKQRQASTFLNYYLPTTLKLLDSYAKFEEAGIEGENLSRAQERIEETMDALVKGFDKQLDDLYRSEAMDIDSDIRVMENMLRRDGASAADDFDLGGAAAQRVPGGK